MPSGARLEAVARNDARIHRSWFRTRSTYDIRGNVLTVTDALDRVAFRYTYDLANRPWRIDSIDAGLRRMVLNVLGNEIERRDSKGALILQAYDRLQRPIRLWARDDAASPITLRQRMEYGDAGTPDQAARSARRCESRNLLGQLIATTTKPGSPQWRWSTSRAMCSTNPAASSPTRRSSRSSTRRRPTPGSHALPGRLGAGAAADPRRPRSGVAGRDRYQTTASFDALNRIKRLQFPQDVEGQRRELRPDYNRAGGLEQVWLDDTLYVERIAYDAKGQRALIAYGNGVMTRYAYDPHTFRLKRLRSERYFQTGRSHLPPGGEALQDFGYDYDLVGNILAIRDRTPGSGILNNPEASTASDPALAQLLASGNALNRRFDYDPIYRLLSATGRECDRPPDGAPVAGPAALHRSHARARLHRALPLRRHGQHAAPGAPQWRRRFTREFTVEAASNRLRRMQIGQPLRLHLRRQRQHALGDHLAPLRVEPQRPDEGLPHPDRRRRALGACALPLRRRGTAGEEAGAQAGRAGRGHPLHRRAIRASPLGRAITGRREQPCACDG